MDTYIRAGAYTISNVPYVPGMDCAGTVEAAGAGVTRFKAGDRVYSSGTVSGAYAEFALCQISTVHPLPGNVSFPQGAALGLERLIGGSAKLCERNRSPARQCSK